MKEMEGCCPMVVGWLVFHFQKGQRHKFFVMNHQVLNEISITMYRPNKYVANNQVELKCPAKLI